MIDQLAGAFDFHQTAVALRQERHELIASNIANADTPNYKARDIDFASALEKAVAGERTRAQEGLELVRTSPRHIPGQAEPILPPVDPPLYRIPAQPSLDGNTVEMDQERTQFLDNALRYRVATTLVDRRIKGLKEAMQPE